MRQFEVRRQETLIGRVDLTYPERRLALEADGYRYHSGRAAWGRDLARGNGLLLAGWRVLRFTSADLRQRPDDVVEAVRRAHAESF